MDSTTTFIKERNGAAGFPRGSCPSSGSRPRRNPASLGNAVQACTGMPERATRKWIFLSRVPQYACLMKSSAFHLRFGLPPVFVLQAVNGGSRSCWDCDSVFSCGQQWVTARRVGDGLLARKALRWYYPRDVFGGSWRKGDWKSPVADNRGFPTAASPLLSEQLCSNQVPRKVWGQGKTLWKSYNIIPIHHF